MTEDTIAAIATPLGRGGLGVVRISGERALEIASSLVRLSQSPPQVQHATRGDFIDITSGETLDQVVLTYFKRPRSYTGEDVIEISCHGSPVILHHLLESTIVSGSRLAEPGEFTMRAFLNGRIDLTQAEAVRDLIDSRTLYQARVAAQQIGGAVSARLRDPKAALVELIARLEAGIDFAEDDVPVSEADEILSRIAFVEADLARMAQSYGFGRLLREGLSLAIVGRPNVGKSSLFNRLLNQDRAIVTSTPGTTRDLITESASLCGIPVRLVDTAGIRETEDQVERIGVEKSRQAIADSDLRLLVVDASEGWTEEDERLFQKFEHLGRVVVAANKCDLVNDAEAGALSWTGSAAATAPNRNSFPTRPHETHGSSPVALPDVEGGTTNRNSSLPPLARGDYKLDTCSPLAPLGEEGLGVRGSELAANFSSVRSAETDANFDVGVVWTSALTGEGLPELQERMLALVSPARESGPEGEVITSLRQQECIHQALASLAKAREAAPRHIPHEMLLIDLYDALHALDALTGATTNDDLLGIIFSSFCIGK